MRQTRIIRISFLLCAAFTVVAFWSGFYFGNTNSTPEQILTASGETGRDTETAAEKTTAAANVSASEDSVKSGGDEADETVESMKALNGNARYYIKDDGEYLSVYYSDTDEIFFETDLKLSDLPAGLQEEAKTGIRFSDPDELYDFLENYSS